MNPFSPCDVSTWPLLLTADQIAAIWQRPVGGIKKQCQHNAFLPAPCEKQPYRWRKVDVVRYLEGGRIPAALRRVS